MKLGNVLLLTIVMLATAALAGDGAWQDGLCPEPIAAGHDLWESGRDGDLFPPDFDFGVPLPPIPADFFGPGSDPFDGHIYLTGEPLQTSPSGAFGLADAIVERPAPTVIPDPSSPPVTIPIELVALSLVSIQPITVTYNGGQSPEMWDVKVCLSEMASSPGTMDISSDCCEGGTFQAELNIMPRFAFTRQSNAQESVLDFGWEGYPSVPWTYNGSWAVELSPPDIPGPVQVDHDCYAATSDIVVGPSPRLLVTGSTGTPWFGDPCAACPDPIAAGHDLWESARDGDIFPPAFFFGTDAPPLPADFFGPGSDPFAGLVGLTGDPFQTTPSGAFGLADAIIERVAPTAIPDPSSPPVPIPIELVALSLISIQPITVTYDGGQNPEQWDVKVCLSEAGSSPGTLDISADCCEGGTFQAELNIMPRFTFTRVSGTETVALDFYWENYTAVPWTYDGKWLAEVSPPDIPGPVQVDHDCYAATTDIEIGPSPRLLITGGTGTPWFGDPCSGECPNPIAAGHDLWESARDGDIFPPNFDFGADSPPIPADFFGPGSDPFDRQIDLTGDPLSFAFGLADAIVARPAPAAIPDPLAPPQTIPIELVALSLISIAPITVTYNGGQNPEEWDVKVCLSEIGSSPGIMDISTDCCEGGTFYAELNIQPRFTFTRVSDAQVSTLDFYWEVYPAVPWAYDGRWAVEPSPPDIPGPVQVDHDCYAATPNIVVGPSPRLLVTGGTGTPWFGDPCSGCCVDRVGDCNLLGGDEPTIGDISVLIDAKFITGVCEGIVDCFEECDINQSGGYEATCDDITIGDISTLIDYLFITGPSLGLAECL